MRQFTFCARLAILPCLLLVCPAYPSTGDSPVAAAFAPPEKLTATLVEQANIVLNWKNRATHPRGYFVEYTPTLDEEFVILGAVPAHTTEFLHPDVAAGAKFIYRVRPFFGYVSNLVEITSGPADASTDDASEWALPQRSADASTVRHSIRHGATAAKAAPGELRAESMSSTAVRLTWTDRASDEDGYLVEIRSASQPDFRVCALLEPDTTSFGILGLPPESVSTFRVRAFFYGQPSNLAEQHTPETVPPLLAK